MTVIDVNELLTEVTPDRPCGEDLEYDPAFIGLETTARGKPEQQEGETIVPAEPPNWSDVRDQALELLNRTKDLRIAAYLSHALLHTEGFAGLSDGLSLLREFIERHWEDVHPQLDPEDDNDPTMRVNVISSLCDPDTMVRDIRRVPLTNSWSMGKFSLRDVQVATSELPATEPDEDSEESTVPEMATIEAAFMDTDLDELQATCSAVEQCLETAGQIEAQLMERVGPTYAPDMGLLASVCKEIHSLLTEKLTTRQPDSAEEVERPDGVGEAKDTSFQRMSGEVGSRDDVLRVFDKVCDYYRRHEPSSPVPLLVQRARRLVCSDFMEIIRDLAPEGMSQAEAIAGSAGDENSDADED